MRFILSFFIICLVPVSLIAANGNKDAANALSEMDRALAQQEEDFTLEDEYYLGRTVGAVILGQYKPYTRNPGLSAYLNTICRSIVINSPKPEIFNGYHVMILDSPDINAFATTGGHIFITLGLITIANSEDTLAAVIAHEIAHVQLRHSIEMIQNTRMYQDLSATADRAAKIAVRGLDPEVRRQLFDNSIREITNTILTNGYSQTQEFDADSYAMALLAATGYEPSSLIEVLQILAQSQSGVSLGLSRTHPDPQFRIANAAKSTGNYHVQDTRAFRRARFNTATKNLIGGL